MPLKLINNRFKVCIANTCFERKIACGNDRFISQPGFCFTSSGLFNVVYTSGAMPCGECALPPTKRSGYPAMQIRGEQSMIPLS
jgi:hypothetical protein